MISVLLPSRGRPEKLKETIDNLQDTAGGPIEILVAADQDDVATIDLASDYLGHVHVSAERYGYGRLNEYYNVLSNAANGQWQLLWNDDSVMLTANWVQAIESLPGYVMVAELKDQLWPRLVCFPAVRSEAVRAVGGFSLYTQHCDTYWQEIGRRSGTSAAIEVHLRHERFDLTGLNDDLTFRESRHGYASDGDLWAQAMRQVDLDAGTIAGLLWGRSLRLTRTR